MIKFFNKNDRLLVLKVGLLALLAMIILLTVNLSWLGTSPFIGVMQDSAHVPFFMLLTLIIAAQLERTRFGSWLIVAKLLCLVSFLTVLGIMVEFLQAYVGRTSSWSDVGQNCVGIVAGLIFYYGYTLQRLKRALCLAMLLLSTCLIQPGHAVYAVQKHQAILPAIAVFDGRWVYQYLRAFSGCRISLVDGHQLASTFNHLVGLVQFQKGRTSGFKVIGVDESLIERSALVLDIHSGAGKAYDLYAAVGYDEDDRIRLGALTIHPGVSSVKVDLTPARQLKGNSKGRQLALTIVSVNAESKRQLHVNRIYME